jgi:hypothetical protein
MKDWKLFGNVLHRLIATNRDVVVVVKDNVCIGREIFVCQRHDSDQERQHDQSSML